MANAIGWPPLLVRVLFVVLSILLVFVPGWLVYVLLWALVPADG